MNGYETTLSIGWKALLDAEGAGIRERWYAQIPPGAQNIIFPTCFQDVFGSFVTAGWFWVEFNLPDIERESVDYLLKIGHSAYLAQYWINGKPVGQYGYSDLFYSLDMTEAVKRGNNLLAIRISDSESGVTKTFDEITPGAMYKYYGVFYPVRIAALPKSRVEEVYIRADARTGEVNADVSLHGCCDGITLTFCVTGPGKRLVYSESRHCSAGNENFRFTVHAPRLWSCDEPNLYTASFALAAGGQTFDCRCERFGFREFVVRDGWFFLNGRRMFVKCGHTGPGTPPADTGRYSPETTVRRLTAYKAAGFNTIRFLKSGAYPEILDICDEIGLMVYEEHPASWLSVMDDDFEKFFEYSLFETVKASFNHPSVTIRGLINESHHERERDIAQTILPRLRKLDDTRLVLYGSGRWDLRMDVGSVSNPGSVEWECQWGGEKPGAPKLDRMSHGVWSPELGDAHIYLQLPVSRKQVETIRTHGQGLKPVFISEGGFGSLGEIHAGMRRREGFGVSEKAPDYRYCLGMSRMLEKDWEKYGLGNIYALPEDMIYDSSINNRRMREQYFNWVRSNPNACGYSLTSLGEGAYISEGVYDEYGYVKPGIADILQEGWAPVRWCLFVEPMNAYEGQPIEVEAVIANEDVLAPGSYPARIGIVSGRYGKVWHRELSVTIPKPEDGKYLPMSFPAYKEMLDLGLKEGAYEISVKLCKGAYAASGRFTFYVTKPEYNSENKVRLVGDTGAMADTLAGYGVGQCAEASVIIAGMVAVDELADIFDMVRNGATALFADIRALADNPDKIRDHLYHKLSKLPFGEPGYCVGLGNWVYHHETLLHNHPFFEGLQNGMLDRDFYGMAAPTMTLCGTENLLFAPAVNISLPESTGDALLMKYVAGEALGIYGYGKGKIILTTFDILGTLASNPATDRLLLNIIRNS